MMDIDKKLNILKIITPKNISSERLKFIESKGQYVPQLEYNEIHFDTKELLQKIQKIEIPDIPLSLIFKRKKEKIMNKLSFIQAFQEQNIENLNYYGHLLYGDINTENLEYAKNVITNKEPLKKETEFLTIEEIKK